MSTRIYALAKQLKIESKALVEICKKLGFDKASALASLTEEEVEEVKKAMAGPSSAPQHGEATPFVRPAAATPSGRVPVLKPTFKSRQTEAASSLLKDPTSEETPPEETETVSDHEFHATAETTVKEAPETDTAPVSPPPRPASDVPAPAEDEESATSVPDESVPEHSDHVAAIRREDYISPMRSILNKVPLLGRRKKPTDASQDKGKNGSSGKAGPMIRLAPVPKTAPDKQPKSPAEPAPQKPDMKLPKEAIRAAAQGTSRPLDDHIRKHEEKQKVKEKGAEKGKGVKKHGKEPDQVADEETSLLKRRGKVKAKEHETTTPHRKGRTSKKQFASMDGEDQVYIPRQLRRQKKGQQAKTTAPRKNDIVIQLPCTVKHFAEQTGLSMANVIKKLMEFGAPMPVLYTTLIDADMAELLGESFGIRLQVRAEKSLEEEYVNVLFDENDSSESLVPRPPVVTFLGHVDHGKTSLLDRILNMNVVSGERGGITQHIRAYRIHTPKGDITFVDTPGHEAFTEMRARGAQCTDIVVLVVAADDGVMPQTEEAISHAKAAGVPIVVALNKIDLPGANPDKAYQELAANDILPSEWGGDVEIVKTSAISGEGIDTLLDTLLIISELREIKANPERPATGIALESEMHADQGVVAKLLVRNGTLRNGDIVLCGAAYGRVKAMNDTMNPELKIEEATPGTPVQLSGLDVAPEAGSPFCVLDDISKAREIAEERAAVLRSSELADMKPQVTLENLFQRISSGTEVQTLNIIIRADVRGSIEAIRKELGKLEHPEVKLKILQATVGGITEADVQLADASEGIIVGFNVVPDEGARALAEKKKIQIRRYDIIYNLAADIKAALEGLLKPLSQQKELGRALIQQTFSVSRLGTIAGCRVLSGTVERDCRIRVIRESRVIGDYPLDSLKREKDDAKEVREGYECGIKLRGYNDVKEGDILEAYKIEEIARTF